MRRLGYLVLGLLIMTLAGCGSESGDKAETQTTQQPQQPTDERHTASDDPNMVTLPSGVRYIELVVGTGEEMVRGDFVKWDYTLFLADASGLIKASALANSVGNDDDYWCGELGVDGLPGLTEGAIGMRLGGKRRIHVPWEQGWGDAEPMPKQNLIFEISNLESITKQEANDWTAEELKKRAYQEAEVLRRQDSIQIEPHPDSGQ